MKSTTLSLALVAMVYLAIGSSITAAQDRGTGVGIVLGEPTGFSFKHWINEDEAYDAGLAWSYVKGTSMHIHADYLVHHRVQATSRLSLPYYYGVGGRLKTIEKETRLGLRCVVGVDFMLPKDPVDIFIEFAPILDLAPATELSFNAGVGVRYFFE